MRSVRLDPELDELVRRAAAQEGASVSEFLRRAAADRARRALAARDQLDDVLGAVRTEGGAARRTGGAFGELLQARRRRQR
jgi:membrane protein involved in colicin uptake